MCVNIFPLMTSFYTFILLWSMLQIIFINVKLGFTVMELKDICLCIRVCGWYLVTFDRDTAKGQATFSKDQTSYTISLLLCFPGRNIKGHVGSTSNVSKLDFLHRSYEQSCMIKDKMTSVSGRKNTDLSLPSVFMPLHLGNKHLFYPTPTLASLLNVWHISYLGKGEQK